jgi:hypothetical protein
MGDPIGVESECKVCSSKLREAGNFISGTDGISIKEGIEMGLFPLLVKEAIVVPEIKLKAQSIMSGIRN